MSVGFLQLLFLLLFYYFYFALHDAAGFSGWSRGFISWPQFLFPSSESICTTSVDINWDFCHWMSFSSRFQCLYKLFLVFKILKGIWEGWLGGLCTSSYLIQRLDSIVSNNLMQSCLFRVSLFEFFIYL